VAARRDRRRGVRRAGGIHLPAAFDRRGRGKKLGLAHREFFRPDWFASGGGDDERPGERSWEFGGYVFWRDPRYRITENERTIVRLYDACREEDGSVKVWPDGRALIDQPTKLIAAFQVLRRLYKENEG
jgi:hypothetical protein